jgi:hypothetical protein
LYFQGFLFCEMARVFSSKERMAELNMEKSHDSFGVFF